MKLARSLAALAASALLAGCSVAATGQPAAQPRRHPAAVPAHPAIRAAGPCTVALGSNCGPYTDPSIPMSNGYDTYVANQDVGAFSGTTESLTATDASNWQVTANAVPLGNGSVQTFPDTQQLTNDWNPTAGNWTGTANTPVDALSALTISYSIAGPANSTDPNAIFEYAPDIWQTGYPGQDVMFWADTEGRCNTGSYGSTVLGNAVFDGQTWTVNRYGGAGAEIIFVLDSNPAVPDSCAQQTSGTIDVQAGIQWLIAHGYVTDTPASPDAYTQVNTGFEITSMDSQTLAVSGYAINATVAGPAPTPTVTATPTPSATPTSPPPPSCPAVGAWNTVTSFPSGWTGTLSWKVMGDCTVQVTGHLTVPAGVGNPSTILTLPAAGTPASVSQPLLGTENGGAPFLGIDLVTELLPSGVLHVYDAKAGDTLRVSGRYPTDL